MGWKPQELRRTRGHPLDVAEGNLAVIALQGEVAGVGLGEHRHLAELALGDAGVEIFAAQDVLEIFHAVDFVLAFLRADEQADVVPLAGGFRGIEGLAGLGIVRRLIERVEPAAALRVGGFGVVLELEFRAGRPGAPPSSVTWNMMPLLPPSEML